MRRYTVLSLPFQLVVPGVASFATVVNYERKMFMKQVANIEMESTVFASLTHRAGHIQKHSYIVK